MRGAGTRGVVGEWARCGRHPPAVAAGGPTVRRAGRQSATDGADGGRSPWCPCPGCFSEALTPPDTCGAEVLVHTCPEPGGGPEFHNRSSCKKFYNFGVFFLLTQIGCFQSLLVKVLMFFLMESHQAFSLWFTSLETTMRVIWGNGDFSLIGEKKKLKRSRSFK